MSAFLAAVYADRVELLSDGACLAEDGTVAAIEQKVWVSPHCPLAVTGRGNFAMIKIIATGIMVDAAGFQNVDRSFETLERLFADQRRKGAVGDLYAEMLIAGFSETKGPVASYFRTHVEDALVLHPIEGVAYAGPKIDFAADSLGKGLRQAGAYAMDRARRTPDDDKAQLLQGPVYGVGGRLDLTIISATGAVTQRLKKWPDIIGERIQPTNTPSHQAS